jgi:hypothetical protein
VTDAQVFNILPVISGVAGDSVTLVAGTSFAISAAGGDIDSDGAQGLFFDDTRFVSCWRVRLDDAELEKLAVIAHNPFNATFLSRGQPQEGRADSTIVVVRNRLVGNGMREEIVVRNLAPASASCRLSFELDADFAIFPR